MSDFFSPYIVQLLFHDVLLLNWWGWVHEGRSGNISLNNWIRKILSTVFHCFPRKLRGQNQLWFYLTFFSLTWEWPWFLPKSELVGTQHHRLTTSQSSPSNKSRSKSPSRSSYSKCLTRNFGSHVYKRLVCVCMQASICPSASFPSSSFKAKTNSRAMMQRPASFIQ